jgi:hypothetical protein
VGGEVTVDVQREWIFDGSRGEFWIFLFLVVFPVVSFVVAVIQVIRGTIPRFKVDWITWYTAAILLWGAFAFRRWSKWFSLAIGAAFLQTCLHILIAFGNFRGPSALSTWELMDLLSSVLMVAAFSNYLGTKLRREIVGQKNPIDQAK